MVAMPPRHKDGLQALAEAMARTLDKDPFLTSTQQEFAHLLIRAEAEGVLDILVELAREPHICLRPPYSAIHTMRLPQPNNHPRYLEWTAYWDGRLHRPGTVDLGSISGQETAVVATMRNRTNHHLIVPLPVQIRVFQDEDKRKAMECQAYLERVTKKVAPTDNALARRM